MNETIKYFMEDNRNNFSSWFCLDVALEREIEGDGVLGDMGEGLPFRAGSFDAAIR